MRKNQNKTFLYIDKTLLQSKGDTPKSVLQATALPLLLQRPVYQESHPDGDGDKPQQLTADLEGKLVLVLL